MASPTPAQRRAQGTIAAELGRIGFALPGSLVARSTACGKATCRCQGDPPVLHGPYLTWTRTVDGKTVTCKISEEELASYQSWFDNARQLRRLVTALEVLSLEAFNDARARHRR